MTDAVVPPAADRWLYHFTHADNLGAIRAAGRLRCDAIARQGMTLTEVGAKDGNAATSPSRVPPS
jgi:hypothetical protein